MIRAETCQIHPSNLLDWKWSNIRHKSHGMSRGFFHARNSFV
jgi:hypothetical protein